MKKLVIMAALLIAGLTASAQTTGKDYVREGKTFTSVSTRGAGKAEPKATGFTWKDSKGKAYDIYMSGTGSCFVLRVSQKTGKEYRQYLGKEISAEICKEMGVEYKPQNTTSK